MAFGALTAAFLLLNLCPSAGTPGQATQAPRFDEELAAIREEPDATARARARVEILYRAGDLPGALRGALAGLRLAPADLLLLRRALELEAALRLPDLAREHAERLEQAVRRDPLDPEARVWWERETASLSEAARRIQAHETSLRSATSRARWVSLAVLGVLALSIVALARAAPRAGGRIGTAARKTAPPASG